MKDVHLPYSLLKSTFDTVWAHCHTEMEETSMRKFRNIQDVNIWLLRYWQIVSGEFYPQSRHFGRYFGACQTREIEKVIQNRSVKTICIGDGNWRDITKYKEELYRIFNSVFPKQSSFEL